MALEQNRRVTELPAAEFVAMVTVDDIIAGAWLKSPNPVSRDAAIQACLIELRGPQGIDLAVREITRFMADVEDPRFQRKFRPGSIPDIDPHQVIPDMIDRIEVFLTMRSADQLDFINRAQQAQDTGFWS